LTLFLNVPHRYGLVNSLTKTQQPLLDSAMGTCLERCSLMITAFIISTPPARQISQQYRRLRTRSRDFELPGCSLNLHSLNGIFVIKCLFKFVHMWTCFYRSMHR